MCKQRLTHSFTSKHQACLPFKMMQSEATRSKCDLILNHFTLVEEDTASKILWMTYRELFKHENHFSFKFSRAINTVVIFPHFMEIQSTASQILISNVNSAPLSLGKMWSVVSKCCVRCYRLCCSDETSGQFIQLWKCWKYLKLPSFTFKCYLQFFM